MLSPQMQAPSDRARSQVAIFVAILVALAVGRVAPASAAEESEFRVQERIGQLVALLQPKTDLGVATAPILGQGIFSQSPGPLSEAHKSISENDCGKCHEKGKASKTLSSACTAEGCHASDIGRNRTNKTGLHGSQLVINRTCGECHSDHQGRAFDMIDDPNPKAKVGGQTVPASAWGVAMQSASGSQKSWDHDLTGYKLIGGHKIDCDKCHKPTEKRASSSTRTFLGTDQACLSCHENYHKFPAGDRNEDCLICHTFFSWKKFNRNYDHSKTAFPLKGGHQNVECSECHAKGKPFAPLAHDTCETCHAGDGLRVHAKTFATHKCEFCHSEGSGNSSTRQNWARLKVETRDHKKYAKYDAEGAHAKLACATCHKGLKSTPEKGADGECTACHNNIHGEKWVEKKPCEKCHTQERWTPLTVENKDHKSWSRFDLTGRHLQLDCVRCHRDLAEIPQQRVCGYCHTDFHEQEKGVSRGKNCAQCHNTSSWQDSFDHNKTKFPLTGQHVEVECEKCHKEMSKNVFKHDTACKSCHPTVHLGKLSDDCTKCHETKGWEDEKFDHQKDSDFPLTGRHQQVDCYKCHLDLGFKGTPERCNQCHWDYHKGAWGPTQCDQCHNERRWNVERNTLVFQTLHNYGEIVLAGAHERLDCETCHAPQPRWLMTGFGGECNTCHPDVHLGGRGQECHQCHDQRAWLPARFDHVSTGFPLWGSHRFVECKECHRGNLYAGLPDECVFCHYDDAVLKASTATHGPNLGYGNDCDRCHMPTTWKAHNP